MNVIRLLADGSVLAILNIKASADKRRGSFSLLIGAGLVFMMLEVYFIYRGQENSDLFFWHGYLSWTIGNLATMTAGLIREKDERVQRHLLLERLLLWQVVVAVVFAGFSLTTGWLMKLYIR